MRSFAFGPPLGESLPPNGDATKDELRIVNVPILIHDNPGTHRSLVEGVSELKIDFGPGYRVYYAIRGEVLLLLLVGGDKSTQRRDIQKALELNRNYQE